MDSFSLRISAADDDETDAAAIERFALDLRAELADLHLSSIEQVSVGPAPEGARALELLAVFEFIITMGKAGESINTILETIRTVGERYTALRKRFKVTVADVEIDLATANDEQLRTVVAAIAPTSESSPLSGVRKALIIANKEFDDPALTQLRAPTYDADALARVLGNTGIGGFDVELLTDADERTVRLRIAAFFAERSRDDVLLVHFSGHGVKDARGRLYLTARDTRLSMLSATGIPASFVNDSMAETQSNRVVLILDCCYSGAFARGTTVRADDSVHIADEFGAGNGRIVLTASSATEYAFEGTELTRAEGQPSAFTSALVSGLETGAADLDNDGEISIDELYDYTYRTVRASTPGQAPMKWTFGVEGSLVIARSVRTAILPRTILDDIDSDRIVLRLEAVKALAQIVTTGKPGLRAAAEEALVALRDHDDSSRVRASAAAILSPVAPSVPPALPTPPPMSSTRPAPPVSRTSPPARPATASGAAPASSAPPTGARPVPATASPVSAHPASVPPISASPISIPTGSAATGTGTPPTRTPTTGRAAAPVVGAPEPRLSEAPTSPSSGTPASAVVEATAPSATGATAAPVTAGPASGRATAPPAASGAPASANSGAIAPPITPTATGPVGSRATAPSARSGAPGSASSGAPAPSATGVTAAPTVAGHASGRAAAPQAGPGASAPVATPTSAPAGAYQPLSGSGSAAGAVPGKDVDLGAPSAAADRRPRAGIPLLLIGVLTIVAGILFISGFANCSQSTASILSLPPMIAAALMLVTRQRRYAAVMIGALSWQWVLPIALQDNSVKSSLGDLHRYAVLGNLLSFCALAVGALVLMSTMLRGDKSAPLFIRIIGGAALIALAIPVTMGIAFGTIQGIGSSIETANGWVYHIGLVSGLMLAAFIIVAPHGATARYYAYGWLAAGLELAIYAADHDATGQSKTEFWLLFVLLLGVTVAVLVPRWPVQRPKP